MRSHTKTKQMSMWNIHKAALYFILGLAKKHCPLLVLIQRRCKIKSVFDINLWNMIFYRTAGQKGHFLQEHSLGPTEPKFWGGNISKHRVNINGLVGRQTNPSFCWKERFGPIWWKSANNVNWDHLFANVSLLVL